MLYNRRLEVVLLVHSFLWRYVSSVFFSYVFCHRMYPKICHHMPPYASICLHMPPYATICLHMPPYATICLYMPIALKVWYKILVKLHIVCLHMPLYATICHYMPPYATICHYMPPYATICLHMPLYASKGICLCGFAGVHQRSYLSLLFCVTYIFMCCQSLAGFCCNKLHEIRAARASEAFSVLNVLFC